MPGSRWLAVLPLTLLAMPAAAQSADVVAAIQRAAPEVRDYCVNRLYALSHQPSHDGLMLDCLRFRTRYPMRGWVYPDTGQPVADTRLQPRVSPPAPYDIPSPAERYFPPLNVPRQFADRSDADVLACNTENRAFVDARYKALREGRALADYRLRVLQMPPSELAAESERIEQILAAKPGSGGTLRPQDGDDEDRELARHQQYFLILARGVAAGERVYREQNDDLEPLIRDKAEQFAGADIDYGRAMFACFARRDAAAAPQAAAEDHGDWMTGTFDTGGGLMTLTRQGGRYAYANGRLSVDAINGAVMEGIWTQDSSGQQCKDGGYHGRFRLVFTENGFNGLFGYCDESPAAVGGFYGTRRRQ